MARKEDQVFQGKKVDSITTERFYYLGKKNVVTAATIGEMTAGIVGMTIAIVTMMTGTYII